MPVLYIFYLHEEEKKKENELMMISVKSVHPQLAIYLFIFHLKCKQYEQSVMVMCHSHHFSDLGFVSRPQWGLEKLQLKVVWF